MAQALNVSRQIISAWENGKKDIPDERKKQLSDYFGIDAQYFDEIQKKKILGTSMYRWNHNGDEFFLFRPDEESQMFLKGLCTYEPNERKILLSDELKEKKQLQKGIVRRIDQQIEGQPWYNLHDQITSINRGTKYYQCCVDTYEAIYNQSSSHKMSYYYRALEVVDALLLAFGGEVIRNDDDVSQYFEAGDYTYRIDPDFVQKCADMIKEHMKPIIKNLDLMDKKMEEIRNKKVTDTNK